ncbi:MAG: tyrosine-type recombinase/integrase [Clostridiales bacterium]|nr:tyrosine-type recombinase/integrase [Clostridiales bacterium]
MLKSDFYSYCTLKGLSKSTLEYYEDVLNYYQDFLGGKAIENTSVSDIKKYQHYLHDKDLALASIRNYLIGLKVFYRYIGKMDIVKSIVLPNLPKKQVEILSVEEMQLLLKSCKTLRDEIIILLMLDCGLRRSEVCRLKVTDWQFNKRLLLVKGKGSKERFQRVGHILSDKLEVYLNDCHSNTTDYLLYTRRSPFLTPSCIAKVFSNLRQATGINVYPHMLRHNYATLYMVHSLMQGNSDLYRLQVLMGHSSQATTLKYLHIAQEQLILSNSYSIIDDILSC